MAATLPGVFEVLLHHVGTEVVGVGLFGAVKALLEGDRVVTDPLACGEEGQNCAVYDAGHNAGEETRGLAESHPDVSWERRVGEVRTEAWPLALLSQHYGRESSQDDTVNTFLLALFPEFGTPNTDVFHAFFEVYKPPRLQLLYQAIRHLETPQPGLSVPRYFWHRLVEGVVPSPHDRPLFFLPRTLR